MQRSADSSSEASAKEEARLSRSMRGSKRWRAQAEARDLLLNPGAKIGHYSIVEQIGAEFLVMEFVPGASLARMNFPDSGARNP